MAPYVRRNARRPEHVTFLQEVCFSPPDRRVEINPDYRPASPIGTIVGIPIPGYNIHPDLLFCPYIWQITSTEISYRQHYAILPGVQTVTIERATGWHICRFGPDKSDGWYYLEHYLAMEERRELEVQTRGSTEPGIPPIYVVTVRPAFDWTEYYRLSPPGYRQYGLFYTMGTGIGPVLALDGFHKQPPLPGIKFNYQPDSPERRLGNGFVVPDNQPRPNYRNLAWNSQHLLHIWQHWERYQCILVSMARDQPGMSGILTYQTSESKSISWFRYHQDLSIALGYAGYNIRRLEGQAAGPMAQGDVPVQFGSYLMDPRRPPAPPPIVGLNMHQGPYSQNNQAVNPNASLRIELNYNQGGEGGLPTMLELPEVATAQEAVRNDRIVESKETSRPASDTDGETSRSGSSTGTTIVEDTGSSE